jgi:primosomal protein N' (replication factor Y)
MGPDSVRALLRTPLERGPELAAAMTALRAVRSARKEAAGVQVVMNPSDLAG